MAPYLSLDYKAIKLLSVSSKEYKKGCLGPIWIFFSSLITPHSIFVTHHSSLKIPHHSTRTLFGTITQLIITQYFLIVCRPHTCHLIRAKLFCYPGRFSSLSFSLFSFPLPSSALSLPKAETRTHKNFSSSHRCSNQNPQIPKSKITNTYPLFEVKDRNIID